MKILLFQIKLKIQSFLNFFAGQICRNPISVRNARRWQGSELFTGKIQSGGSKSSGTKLSRFLSGKKIKKSRENADL